MISILDYIDTLCYDQLGNLVSVTWDFNNGRLDQQFFIEDEVDEKSKLIYIYKKNNKWYIN
jgi:hypothetical protein